MGYKRFGVELSELVGRTALLQTTCFHTLWNIISYGHERIPPSLTSLTENNNYFFSPQRTQSLKNGSPFFFQASRKLTEHFFAYSFCRLTGFSENLVQFASMTGSRNVFILTDALKEKTSDLLIWTLLQGCFTSSIHFERFLVFTWIIFLCTEGRGQFLSGTPNFFLCSPLHLLLIFWRWKIIIYWMD